MATASKLGKGRIAMPANFAAVYRAANRIPRGRVATYGQLGELAGFPRGARLVATALKMSAAFGVAVPWHRVIGKRGAWGKISILDPIGAAMAKGLLENEGVAFTASDYIDLARFGVLAAPPYGRASRKTKPATARNRRAAPRR